MVDEILSSSRNPKIKSILALRERRERQQRGLMLVEGYDEINLAMMQRGIMPLELYVCEDLFPKPEQKVMLAKLRRVPTFHLTYELFHKVAYREKPDGWLAVAKLPQLPIREIKFRQQPFILVAEAIEKPGNLGALLRTADAAGVDAVIAADPLTDWGNPNVIRASKGTVLTMQVSDAISEASIAWLRSQKIQIVTASPEAEDHIYYAKADFRPPTALVVGTEHEGVSQQWKLAADIKVTIPMFGTINSLNVSVAAAALMYEVVRQRH